MSTVILSYCGKHHTYTDLDLSATSVGEIKTWLVDTPDTHRLVYKGKTLLPDISSLADHIAVGPVGGSSSSSSSSSSASKKNTGTTSSMGESHPPRIHLMLLGSSTSAIAAVHTLDTRHHHDQRQPSLAAARSVVSSAPMTHYFHSIKAIDTFPDAHRAVALLDRLRSDWGVRAAMLKRGWHVHVLSELHPAQASILGYNRNKGHEISLRLRTDRLDGFRMYSSLRDVLIHELAHMTHSEHNSQFHALNRELTKEIAATNSGTDLNERHTAIYHGPSDPKLQSESILSASGDKLLQGGVHRLGGGQLAVANEAAPDGHTSRQVLAAAALLRLTAKEEHITGGCSTSD